MKICTTSAKGIISVMALMLLILPVVVACSNDNETKQPTPMPTDNHTVQDNDEPSTVAFTQKQRSIADQIISVFENNTLEMNYSYTESLDDGRGITAGRAGFTSETGDMLVVVERYTQRAPDNPLASYLPRLRELAEEESDCVDGLENLQYAWQMAAKDPVFRTVQDEVVNEEYYWPAVQHTEGLGLSFPLSLLNLYDACIQHGNGDDPDGLPAIISRATAQVGGTPANGIDEYDWLQAFMEIRRSVLLNPSDPETRNVWADSVGRVDSLTDIFASGNIMLIPPIVINPYGTAFTLTQ
jgi:chitosanase